MSPLERVRLLDTPAASIASMPASHDVPSHVSWTLSRSNAVIATAGTQVPWEGKRALSHLESLSLVPQLAELGVREVTLRTAGAPLQLDWLELVRALREQGIACDMMTSGHGFHVECANAAARAGLRNVSVALDGLEPTHDHLHGARGVFRTALEALTNLRAAGVPVSVHTEVCRPGVPDLTRLLACIVAHGVHSWHVARMVILPGARLEVEGLLSDDDLLSLVPLLDELERRCDQAGVRLSLGASLDFVAHEASFCSALPRQSGVERGGMLIQADGVVALDSAWRDEPLVLGSLRDSALAALWEQTSSRKNGADSREDVA